MIEKYTPNKNMKILDVGCGCGALLKVLSEHGEVHGIDFSEKAVSLCNTAGFRNVKKCSADSLDYPDNTFDLVVLSDILEHLLNDPKAMKEAKRVLKPGGVAIITVPANQKLWTKSDVELHHYRRYSKKQLQKLFKDLKVLKFSYIHFAQYFPLRVFKNLRNSEVEWEVSGKGKTFKGIILGFLLKTYTLFESYLVQHINLPKGAGLLAVVKK
jgi:ubiquinone/menaquinone biosynthesis C-methylase UbiE